MTILMRVGAVIGCVAACAGAFSVGKLSAHNASVPLSPPAAQQAEPPAERDEMALRAEIASDVRAVVRQELAAQQALPGRATPPSAKGDAGIAQAEEAPPPPGSVEAATGAHRVIEAAIASGRWTEHDLESMRALKGRLTHEQLLDIQTELFPAVNSGALVVTYPGPLL
jgi:hypothetical protein